VAGLFLRIQGLFWSGLRNLLPCAGITSIAHRSHRDALAAALAEKRWAPASGPAPQVEPIGWGPVGMAQALAVIPWRLSRSRQHADGVFISMAGGRSPTPPVSPPAGYPGHQPGRAGGAEDGFCRCMRFLGPVPMLGENRGGGRWLSWLAIAWLLAASSRPTAPVLFVGLTGWLSGVVTADSGGQEAALRTKLKAPDAIDPCGMSLPPVSKLASPLEAGRWPQPAVVATVEPDRSGEELGFQPGGPDCARASNGRCRPRGSDRFCGSRRRGKSWCASRVE